MAAALALGEVEGGEVVESVEEVEADSEEVEVVWVAEVEAAASAEEAEVELGAEEEVVLEEQAAVVEALVAQEDEVPALAAVLVARADSAAVDSAVEPDAVPVDSADAARAARAADLGDSAAVRGKVRAGSRAAVAVD